jgi:hypothetical protein
MWSSDQVDGLGSAAIHKVARVLVEKEVRLLFESVRKAWAKQ